MTKRKYLMTKITPKNGVLRNVHVGILDKECKILELDLGHSCTFMYERNGENRCVYTSPVVNIKYNEYYLVIETMNTAYELEIL